MLVFTSICFIVTLAFRADVDAQAGAYATGVLAVIMSATVAVTLAAHRARQARATVLYGIVAALFVYTLAVTIFDDPEGLQISLLFIGGIVVTSLISRTARSTELRASRITFDALAEQFIAAVAKSAEIRIIANQPDDRTSREYLLKEREEREASNIPADDPVLFLEVTVTDASEFAPSIRVDGEMIEDYRVLRAFGASVPNTIAAVALEIEAKTGCRPHIYFGWVEGNPLKYLARFVLFGEGDTAPVTREILRKAVADPKSRPAIHVG